MADLEAAMARERARGTLVDALADAEESLAAAWEAGERARVLAGFLPSLRNMAEVATARYGAGRGTLDESLRVEAQRVVYRESSPGVFDAVEVVLGPRAGEWYPVAAGVATPAAA